VRLHINPNPTLREASIVGRELREQEHEPLEELGLSPADSCMEGISGSEYVFTINTDDGKPIAIIGLVEHATEEDTGVVWSMATNLVAEYPIAFVKVLRDLIDEYGGLYSRLISLALSDKPRHQHFQKLIGMIKTEEEISIPHTSLKYLVYELITAKGLNKLYYEQS
jgi:hypothetical protein